MADDGRFAKNADIQARAGAGASAVSKAVAWTDLIILDVEAFINTAARFNFSDAYVAGTLQEDTKYIVRETAACLAAIYVICYDMSGYNSRIEAEDMINVLRDIALRNIALLKDKKVSDFVREVV